MNFDYNTMLTILENYKIQNIKKSGNFFICSCPWHKDNKPSFSISFLNGSFRCFSCGERGDFYTFKSKIEGISYEEAKRSIEGNFNQFYFNNLLKESVDKLNIKEEIKENYTELLNVKRLDSFNNSDILLKSLNISKFVASKCNLGICLDKKYYGRLAIPLYLDDKIYWELRDLTKKSKTKCLYTKGTHVGDILYCNKMSGENYAFLVEGTKDVLTLNSFGYNAMCCFGINVSEQQISLMIKNNINTVFILYDNDVAGKNATKKNYPILKKYIDCKIINWGSGFPKDPNECTIEQIIRLISENC